MHSKLHQLVISALKRNYHTAHLSLTVSLRGYQVNVTGEVASETTVNEVIRTIQSVSPMLHVHSQLKIIRQTTATSR
jgi:hypothetical protein